MGKIIGIVILVGLAIFIGPWIVMTGWNMIVAEMFGLPTLTYWPAFFGTLAMHILFSGMRIGSKSDN